MLRELRVQNFVLIDDLTLSFASGFNVLTGETGAGKSLLIGALSLLLGERAPTDLIRTGSEEAQVEGLFDRPPASASGADFPVDGEEVVLRRQLQRNGKGRVYINGSMATLAQLDALSAFLFEIHGQHTHIGLTDPNAQLRLLDAFCKTGLLREEYLRGFLELRSLKKEKEELELRIVNQLKEKDFICFNLGEIEAAALSAGEEEELLREEKRLRHAQEISRLAQASSEALNGENGVLESLGTISDQLLALDRLSGEQTEPMRMLEEAVLNLKEVARSLGRQSRADEFDPNRLDQISGRLQEIARLKKKYGAPSCEALLAECEALRRRLGGIEGGEERLPVLEDLIREREGTCGEQAKSLTERRREGSKLLEQQIGRELAALKMEKSRFQVSIEAVPLTSTGSDRIEFLIALPGEPPRGIGKVASGGELSRIMMALKAVLSSGEGLPTLIFDEIDAGIGGAVAERVGRRLRQLARSHQVLCVTHLPQIASLAERHFSVRKRHHQGRMRTEVALLSGEERIEEIARMLGGQRLTATTRQHASEMLSSNLKSKA